MKGGFKMPTKRKDSSYKCVVRSWLVNLRSDAGYTQEMVANGVNMDRATYNQIENGKQGALMNAPKLLAIADFFKLDVKYICFLESEYLKKVETMNTPKGGNEDVY